MPGGKVDESFQGPVEIEGLRITEFGKEVPPGKFQNGILEIRSDLSAGRTVYLEGPEIQVSAGDERVSQATRQVWKWWSLLPPLIAIGLAIWLKDVIIALVVAVFAGAIVLSGDLHSAFLRTIDTHILRQLVPLDGNPNHGITVLFTLFLGAMVGVMSASGGTRALVDSLTRYARTREHGQVMTWLVVAIGVAILAFLVWRLLAPLRLRRRDEQQAAPEWTPDAGEALALLDDADRLAAEGRYDEATHLLLKRSVGQIAAARPDWLEPSSTAREIAELPALPQAARGAFATIAERVERSLFALRSLSADDWGAARAAYAEFALAAPRLA